MESDGQSSNTLANKYFSKRTIDEIIASKSYVENIWGDLYGHLDRHYRNEYYYKNTLFNKVVLGKYSLNTTYALSEVTINKSRADFLVVNSKKVFIVEIKTELDSLEKLIYQIEDYYKVCSIVYILVSEDKYYPTYKLLRDYKVGICVLTKSNNISVKKSPEIDSSKLSHEELFKLLRKKEYQSLVEKEFGFDEGIKEVHKFKAYLNKFKTLEIEYAQKMVFKYINRRKNAVNAEYITRVPLQIRWLVYQSNLNRKKYERLLKNIEGGNWDVFSVFER